MPELPPGTLVKGRYKLLKKLGRGGFGITYIAWDTELRRQVAVKENFPENLCVRDVATGALSPASPELESLYLTTLNDMHREAQTLAGLDHEGVVKVHDVIWGNGSVFCVMTWLPGGTLRGRMDTAQPIAAEESMQWLRYLLDTLAYLHGRGIVHRDLKPENIMFNEKGCPVIIDFGAALNRLSRTTGAVTTQGAFSQDYAAPEQITGKGRIGPWTDFYSLSATWYELLTGIHPENAAARLMQDDLAPLSRAICRAPYPTVLLNSLMRNLSLHIESRFQDVAQWLRCWEDGELQPLAMPKPAAWRRWLRYAAFAGAVPLLAWVVGSLLPLQQGGGSAPLQPVDMAELNAELTRRVRATCKVDEYVAICNSSIEELHAANQRFLAEKDRLLSEFNARFEKAASEKELNKLQSDAHAAFSALTKRTQNEYDALLNDFHRRTKPFDLGSTESVSKQYEPKDINEAALLPRIAGIIFEDEAFPAYSKVQSVWSKYLSHIYIKEEADLGSRIMNRILELMNRENE